MDKFARISVISGFEREFISSLKFLIIGAGAIGNEIVKNLSLFGVGKISVVDFDTIEIHNLTRSIFFREEDVGKPKSDTVVERASAVSKETIFEAINGDFWEKISIQEIKSFDAVLCAVDNFEARIKINSLAKIANVPLINTGIDHRFASVDVFPFGLNDDCACYECSIPNSVYDKISSRYSCGWIRKIYQENNVVPTTCITASSVGSIAVSQVLDLLTFKRTSKKVEKRNSQKILFDTKALTVSNNQLLKKHSCPASTHREKPIKILSADRHFHLQEAAFAQHFINDLETYVEFSEPILVNTTKNGVGFKTYFEIADNFDETVLLLNDERVLDAEIAWGMHLNELKNNFSQYEIPCKYVVVVDDGLEFDLLLEMK
jgi:molybdopterin-synthase adenylyltransferase